MATTGSAATLSAPQKWRKIYNIKCRKCNKTVRNGISCDFCDLWHHFRCANVAEENLSSENGEWKCPVCVQSPSSLDDNGCDNSNDHETLLKIIDVLQEDIKVLSKNYEDLRKSMAEKENRHLEQLYVSRPTDLQLSNRPELPLGNQEELGLPNISTLRYKDEWKHIPSKNNKPAYKLNSSTDSDFLY